MKSVFFINSVDELASFDFETIKNSQIFSFNIKSHKFLEEKNIKHVIAESYLDNDDHKKIFETSTLLWKWYENEPFNDSLQFENINLLSIFDTMELHQILVREIFSFLNLKRILEKEKPTEIVCSNHFSKMIKSIVSDDSIKINIYDNKPHEFLIVWDKISIRFNIGKKPFSISISRKTYTSIKNFLEFFLGSFFNLNYNFKKKKKSILLIEFNPAQYSELLNNLKSNDGNLILFNRRRSAIWNFQSLKILKKNNGKLISENLLLSKSEKQNISKLANQYKNKLESLWKNNSIFEKLFVVENKSFESSISEILFTTYLKRIEEYLLLIKSSKNLFKRINVGCIISLNIIGETEQAVLNSNFSNIPSILLEHGATNYIPEIKDYDIGNMYSIFKDRIALWGKIQENYLLEIRQISKNRIYTTGSPRHEMFFKNQKTYVSTSSKTLLITPQVLQEFHGKVDTNSFLRLEKLLKNIFKVLENFHNVNVIVKMHPTFDPSGEYVKKLINTMNPNVRIFHAEPILHILNLCDTVLNINTEFFPSTILYESLIMNKPVLNIRMMDEIYDFQFVKDNAVLSVSDNENLEKPIFDILFNEKLRENLVCDGQKHVLNYFSHPTNASKELADILKSF